MVLASTATPYYFYPIKLHDSYWIAGDVISISPASFAYHYAEEYLNIKSKKISIVSVGGTNQLPE